nr:hypothetical protein [Streptomyces omiyaensis]
MAQQSGGGAGAEPGPVPRVALRLVREVRGPGVEEGGRGVGDRAQPVRAGAPSDGPGGVPHRDGFGPAAVLAEESVEDLGGAGERRGAAAGGEVGVEGGEGLPGARGAGPFQRAVDTGEAHALRRGPPFVVGARPADRFARGVGSAEPVAESACHDVVEVAGAGGDVIVDGRTRRAIALQRDDPVSLVFDELPEEFVAHVEEGVLAVGGPVQREQPRPGPDQPQDTCRGDDSGGVLDGGGDTPGLSPGLRVIPFGISAEEMAEPLPAIFRPSLK